MFFIELDLSICKLFIPSSYILIIRLGVEDIDWFGGLFEYFYSFFPEITPQIFVFAFFAGE